MATTTASSELLTVGSENRGVELLHFLENDLSMVVKRGTEIFELHEVAKRRNELLNACACSSLFELPDGQFTKISSEKDKIAMLATVYASDQELADTKIIHENCIRKIVNSLNFILQLQQQQNNTSFETEIGRRLIHPNIYPKRLNSRLY